MLRCVFLDRDGVINVKPPDGQYVRDWEQFRFLPNIKDWIRLFNTLGFLVIVLTNQRGVARGLVRTQDLEIIHDKMVAELLRCGAQIDDVFCCPHDDGTCDCRKPAPGLVHRAQSKWKIDVSRSVLIGDSETDRQLARVCGMVFLGVRDGELILVDRG